MADFIFLGSKITADGDCSHYDQPRQLIIEQSHYFPNKGLPIKAIVFPVIVYGCERHAITLSKKQCIYLP